MLACSDTPELIANGVRDGVSEGFKIFAVRKESLPDLLGLKNGDLLREFNGHSLGEPEGLEHLLTVLGDLDANPELLVGYERKGEARTLTLRIE